MILRFPVGHAERHEVIFEFHSSIEFLRVIIDGQSSIWDWRLLPFLPLRSVRKSGMASGYRYSAPFLSRFINYTFFVGREELVKVLIQQETNPWFGNLKKERFRVYVDGSLVEEVEG